LSLPPDAFDALYGTHPNEHVKLIRYPGQASDASQQGVGAHKDSGFLTFLLQDEQPGLQVEVTPGHWVDALPKPGAFVVNIGELLEIATNGYLRATVHRVVSPPARKERVSIAFFPVHSWMPKCRFINYRRSWRQKRTGRPAIPPIPCCVKWA
jgi:Isopenicillin N synthase and related dioxygenases